MKVNLFDGTEVEVDDDRYNTIQRGLSDSSIAPHIFQGMPTKDATDVMAFLVSQLVYTEAQVFEKLYTPMQYERLVPISTEAGEWAESIRYETQDAVGIGKPSSGKGTNINLVDVANGDKTMPVILGNIGYGYTTEELRKSAFLRRPLNQSRQMVAMEGYQRHMNNVGLNGEASTNLSGLFNNASVPTGAAPVGAWQTGPKTPAQILSDINTLISTIWNNTANNDMPDTILLPPTSFAYIASTPRSDNSDMTILKYIKENNLAKVERNLDITFTAGFGLDTAGAGSTKRMIGYVKNPTRVVMHLPMPLRFLAPQLTGFTVQVPGEYKYAGVEFRYPKSAYYMDGL